MARLPKCGYTLDGQACDEKGPHFCIPRSLHAVLFFHENLVHTKGRWARRPFILSDWQRYDIIEPIFGPVVWSEEWECYRRQVTDAYIEIARKNGKSELGAGVALKLTCADDEESAEVYGGAIDIPQARKVFDVAVRMVQLSPVLSAKSSSIDIRESARRIIHGNTGSYYEVIASDAAGNLGHNPSGVLLDEAITQPDNSLWDSLKSAEGARVQPLYFRMTTAGDNPASWAKKEHDEAERVAADPTRAPHRFVYLRNIPKDADVYDEKNWPLSNPALGEFKSIEAMRREAMDARNDPTKENQFRQFQGNQWVQQVTRWMPLHLWDASAGMVNEADLHGRSAFPGLDLASTTDLACWSLLFPGDGPDDPMSVLWRFWTPEAQIPFLDRHTAGQASLWAKQGLLKATPGDWIDYGEIHAQIEADKRDFRLVKVGYDPKEATATAQHMQALNLDIYPVFQGFALSGALKEMMRLVKAGRLCHGGHPVARWNADSVEVKRDDQDRIKIVKPERGASGKRIDGIAALGNSIKVWQDWVEEEQKVVSLW